MHAPLGRPYHHTGMASTGARGVVRRVSSRKQNASLTFLLAFFVRNGIFRQPRLVSHKLGAYHRNTDVDAQQVRAQLETHYPNQLRVKA